MSIDNAETAAMRRALDLARLGPEYGANPQVGAVLIDKDGATIAEGYHRGAGTPHAEAAALAAAGPAARGATMIVTLEPCRHTGRTPPCTQALINAGVRRVVYGCPDPTRAAGGGAAELAAAGLDVALGPLGDECRQLIARWALAVRLHRPHVTAKLAMTLDGKTAASDGTSKWITGSQSRAHAHRLRANFDAIAVGTGTVLADDPALTARDADGELLAHQPVRLVLGARDVPHRAAIRGPGGEFRHVPHHDLAALLTQLFDDGMTRLLVEGGATLIGAFLAAGLVDEVHAYLAPMLLGDGLAAVAPFGVHSLAGATRFQLVEHLQLGADLFARLIKEP